MSNSDTKAAVEKIASLCEMLKGLVMSGTRIEGEATHENIESIRKILEDLENNDNYQIDHEIIGLKVIFFKTSFIYNNFEKLLSSSEDRRQPPEKNFYLIQNEKPFYSDNIDPFFDNYLDVQKLFNFFKNKADHTNYSNGVFELIFLNGKKIVVTDEYKESDLIKIDGLDQFITKFDTDTTSQGINDKEKDKIFKKSLTGFFENCEKIEFSQIIQDFKRLNIYIDNELDIYMSKFSYEDIKKEVEKEKVDFVVRLNKVFSDIQTQLIGVPVSVILAADKLQFTNNKDSVEIFGVNLTNLLVIGGILFYAIVLSMLIRNQNNTLAAIKEEIDHYKGLFETKHKGIAKKFESSFKQINNRYIHQKKMLFTVDILGSIAFGSVFFLFFYATFHIDRISTMLLVLFFVIGISIFIYNNRKKKVD